MIVTIHQPNYAPWSGFFDKLARADVFVGLDTVPFTKGGFQNRVKILGKEDAQWLTVPVLTKGLMGQPTNQVRVDDLKGWRAKHLKTLHTNYGGTPSVELMIDIMERTLDQDTELLAELSFDLIKRVSSGFGFNTELVLASQLGVSGSSSQLLADIVKACGGDEYLSGPSGRKYLDTEIFAEAGIKLSFHSFTPPPYDQGRSSFIGGISILDVVANLGWDPHSWRS